MSLRKKILLVTGLIAIEIIILFITVKPLLSLTHLNSFQLFTQGSILIAIIITLVILLIFIFRLLTRLNTLTTTIQEIITTKENFNSIPFTGSDELAKLTTSINQIRAHEAQTTQREKYYQNLSENLQTKQKLLECFIDSLPDPTFAINTDKQVIIWNKAIEELTGIKKEDILGKGDYAYSIPFHNTPSPLLIDLIGSNNIILPNERIERKGHALYSEIYGSSLFENQNFFLVAKATPLFDESHNTIGAIESIRDVAKRTQAEEQLQYLNTHDPLTGLFNRTHFTLEMDRLTKEQVVPISIIIYDVDGLKLVNDTMGHNAGNNLLLAATKILLETLPDTSIIARIGGDEFAVLLPECNRSRLDEIQQNFTKVLAHYNAAELEIPLSLSIGTATTATPLEDLSFLYREADNNMYHEKVHYNQSTQTPTVKILMKALETKDFVKEGHVDRLQSLVANVGVALGMTERRINALRLLAKFHDIGKVGVPDRILLKQGPLTPSEVAEIQRHCEIGFRIAQTAPILVPVADGILKHHEWWNGNGYPLGLQGKEIPLDCRLLAIADAYDALTSDRPYRKAMSHEKAAAELKRRAGTQFDPELVEIFLNVVESKKKLTKISVINN